MYETHTHKVSYLSDYDERAWLDTNDLLSTLMAWAYSKMTMLESIRLVKRRFRKYEISFVCTWIRLHRVQTLRPLRSSAMCQSRLTQHSSLPTINTWFWMKKKKKKDAILFENKLCDITSLKETILQLLMHKVVQLNSVCQTVYQGKEEVHK